MALWCELALFIVSWCLCHTCMRVCAHASAFAHPQECQGSMSERHSAGVDRLECYGTDVEAGGQLFGFGSYFPSCGFQRWGQAPLPAVLFWKPRNKIGHGPWSSLIAYAA